MTSIRIRVIVRLSLRRIGDLRRRPHITRTVAAAVSEVSPPCKLESNMPLIARNNARIRISRSPLVRGQVEPRARRIGIGPVIDFSRRCLRIVALIDSKAVTRNLTPSDISVEIDFLICNSSLCPSVGSVIEVVVHAVGTCCPVQSHIRIPELVAADMNLRCP